MWPGWAQWSQAEKNMLMKITRWLQWTWAFQIVWTEPNLSSPLSVGTFRFLNSVGGFLFIDVKFQTSKQSELTRMITIVMMENLCGLFSQSKVLLSELNILSLPALDNLPEWFDQIKELNPKNQWELNLSSNGCQGLPDWLHCIEGDIFPGHLTKSNSCHKY